MRTKARKLKKEAEDNMDIEHSSGQFDEDLKEVREILRHLNDKKVDEHVSSNNKTKALNKKSPEFFESIDQTVQFLSTKHGELIQCRKEHGRLSQELKDVRLEMSTLEESLRQCRSSLGGSQSDSSQKPTSKDGDECTPVKRKRVV